MQYEVMQIPSFNHQVITSTVQVRPSYRHCVYLQSVPLITVNQM